MNPSHPIYIPSKSRAETAMTPRILNDMHVPYRLVVEEEQLPDYRERFPAAEILVLDPRYQQEYDACGDFTGKSLGSGPARNFIWDHAATEGNARHWVMDDNIEFFGRFHLNQRIPVSDGAILAAMEDFVSRYRNVAMAGPQYWMFVPSRERHPPFRLNTRIYSCNLIRTDLPFRWRGRYNEDTILSLDVLKAGWVTVLFNAFLQHKPPTQLYDGGNMEAFYASEGTLEKSRMLAHLHPDVARVTWRFGRWHHHVDYRPFKKNRLIRNPDYQPPIENPYRFMKIAVPQGTFSKRMRPRDLLYGPSGARRRDR